MWAIATASRKIASNSSISTSTQQSAYNQTESLKSRETPVTVAQHLGLTPKWVHGAAVGVPGRPALRAVPGMPTLFTIPVLRYMKTYGLTHEQLAMVWVVQREWAAKTRAAPSRRRSPSRMC
jgi:acetyl-CoA acetyltransferase